jgi:hypothetical protein
VQCALVEELLARLTPLRVPPPADSVTFSADQQVIATHSGGFTRASQALAAAADPATRYAEYQHDAMRFFVGSARILAERADFVLVLLGYGLEENKREIVAAIRLYPKCEDETDALLSEPSLALASLIARYGVEYQVEGGQRSVFEPLVVFGRGRFVLPGRIETAEMLEALDVPTGIDDAYLLITSLRVMGSGEVKLFFPILLNSEDYVADVRAARGH